MMYVMMNKTVDIWLLAVTVIVMIESSVNGIIVHKAKVGETAILPCPSDDKFHRFQYWQLKDDEIIGPWNNNEKNKYRYEVWSGRLIIRSVSDTESGFYKCFSKQILGAELKSDTVELLVKKDWEESFESDSTVNVYRAVIGVLALLMLIMLGIFGFFIKRRRSLAFQDSREESPDELIPPVDSKGVYRSTNFTLTKPSTSKQKLSDKDFENAALETDISSTLSLPS